MTFGAFPRRARRLSQILLLALAATTLTAADLPPGLTSRPLAEKSGPRGKTMFTPMPAEETGIRVENNYDDPKMWGEKYREFSLGAIGTGVAIGDYDGDGLPDIFVVSKVEGNHLFRNLGHFKFEDVTAQAGVGGPTDAWKQGATFVDVNNDGLLDIYVCRYNAPNLLYINQGDGTFKEMAHAYGLDVVDASGMAAFADYDRDGWLDLYLLTNVLDAEAHPQGQRDYLFHNNGNGTFTNVTDQAGLFGEKQTHAATWWDYDGDGWPDIYVDNDFKEPDQLYHNNGDGTFTNVLSFVVPHTPHSSMGADLGDINNDGLIDLMVADMATTSRYKDQRGMARVRAGLMDNEEHPEAAPQYMRNAVFLNTGTGRMEEAAYLTGLSATDWNWSVRFEDLDNDGRLDLFVTNGMVRELHNADIVKRTSSLESLTGRIRIWKTSPPLNEHNLAFRNLGNLQFENVSAAWGLDQLGVKFGAAFGDLDGDGDLDLVYVNYKGNVTVLRNDSDSGHRLEVDLRGTVSNRFGVGSTVRIYTASGQQVRQLVLARGYASSSEPMLHFGLGNDTVIDRMTVEWPSGHRQEFDHLAADRRYTVTEPAQKLAAPAPPHPPALNPQFEEVSRSQNLALASREKPLDEVARQPLLPFRHNRLGPGAAFADIDGDGEDDLCLGGAAGERAQLVSNLGGGQFLPPMTSSFGRNTVTADAMALFFDVNGDGHPDLLLTKGGVARPAGDAAYQPRLFLNDGRGGFSPAAADALPAFPESTGVAVAADFDRDGALDVFVGGRVVPDAYPTTPRSALLANRGGKLVDVTDEVAPGLRHVGMVTSALWSDVDGDGWPDLLVTVEWGHVMYFHNAGGKKFEDWTERAGFASAGTGWWNSIAGGDLNGDGRPDYVVGNVGLNTMYHVAPGHPVQAYYGDFGGSQPVLIEAQYEDDKLFPNRGLPQLEAVLPQLARAFPTFESYAKATLDQVFPADKLAAAQHWAATELQSGVFLSQPDGTFRFEPLPRLAQIAPIFGVAVGDFDGDGHADVYAVQNSYAPIAEIGRFDGGLSILLRGDGRGHLTPVPVAESGLLVPRDAKGLAVVDLNLDGWPDFFVTRNNDRTLSFRNKGVAGRNSFGVTLRGPKSNATAIGAQITVRLTDGTTQTAEVYAGSSYLSQSTATQFFGYPDRNPPQEITVRWPDGRTSKQAWTSGRPRILIAEPLP